MTKFDSLDQKLQQQKELRILDRTKQAAQFRGFLADKVSLPLSDALDALTFDPPHLEAVEQRIRMALTAIGRFNQTKSLEK